MRDGESGRSDDVQISPDLPVRHDVIICTRNRPDDLRTALDSIAKQRLRPASVIIVDASDDTNSAAEVERWAAAISSQSTLVTYVHAEPGLPAQRNVGASLSQAEIVHFIDDDVVLEPEYLSAIAAAFADDTDGRVVGVGGLVTNQPSRRPRLWWRLACLDSNREGVILYSGANIVVTNAQTRTPVQWLSGCSMSFRRDVVAQLGFDESLPGYGLMEDADFGFRASRLGQLLVEPRARLVHNTSPIGRWDHARRERAATARRGWFVRKNLPPAAMAAFWWSVLGGAVVQIAVSLATRSRWGLRIALWRLHGAIDFLRGAR